MDRTFRPPGGRVSSALVVSGLCLAALFVAATGGAAASCSDYKIKPFKCGVGLPSDKDVAQSCTEPGQICICKTHDCAEEVDTSVCESGYRYVNGPYAEPPDSLRGISADTGGAGGKGGAGGATSGATGGAAGGGGETASTTSEDRCVPVKFASSTDNIKSTDDNKFCPGEEPKGGSDAGTAGAGGSGGATGTGGMSGGTGGMTGSGGMTGGAGGGTMGTGGATGGATTTSAAGSGTGGSQ